MPTNLASTHTAGVRPAGRESGSDERRRDPGGEEEEERGKGRRWIHLRGIEGGDGFTETSRAAGKENICGVDRSAKERKIPACRSGADRGGGLPRWIRRGGRRCSSLRFLLVCCVFLAKWTVDGREGKSSRAEQRRLIGFPWREARGPGMERRCAAPVGDGADGQRPAKGEGRKETKLR